MTVPVIPGNYYVGIWFLQACETLDVAGTLWRSVKAGAPWQFRYRFRHYRGWEVFESNDVKNWYGVTIPGDRSEEEAVEIVREFFQLLSNMGGRTVEYFPIQGDHRKFIKAVASAKLPWMHIQKVRRSDEPVC